MIVTYGHYYIQTAIFACGLLKTVSIVEQGLKRHGWNVLVGNEKVFASPESIEPSLFKRIANTAIGRAYFPGAIPESVTVDFSPGEKGCTQTKLTFYLRKRYWKESRNVKRFETVMNGVFASIFDVVRQEGIGARANSSVHPDTPLQSDRNDAT